MGGLLFTACKQKVQSNNKLPTEYPAVVAETDSSSIINDYGTWRVIGTEPFWNFYIHKDTFLYTYLANQIDSVFFVLLAYEETQQSSYRFKLKSKEDGSVSELMLSLANPSCSDGMSDNKYTHTALYLSHKGCASELE